MRTVEGLSPLTVRSIPTADKLLPAFHRRRLLGVLLNPATLLHAYTCLPLAYATMLAASAILQNIADSAVLFAILMRRHKADTYLMFTTSLDAFYHLKHCRIHFEMVLLKSNVLDEIQRSLLDGGMHIEDLLVDIFPRFGSSPCLG